MVRWRSRRYHYIAIVASGLTIGGIGYWWTQGSATVRYDTTEVERGDIEETVSALGVMVPSQYVDIGAQVEGQLIKLLVAPGNQVQEGQLVAELDPTQYAAQVAEDQAEIVDLQAQVNAWEAKLALAAWINSANQTLVRTQSTSQQTARQSEADAKVAKATIESLKAQIEKTQNVLKYDQAQLDRTSIHSPISGVVASPTTSAYGTTWSKMDVAHPGQILNNKQTAPILFRVADIDRMMVRAQVSEADVAKLTPGMRVYFTTLGRPDHRIEAKLASIEVTPELINGAIFYDADFEVSNPDHQLLPQMSVQVSFVVAQAKDALVVPLAALLSTQRQNGATVPPCPKQGRDGTEDKSSDCVLVLQNSRPQARAVTVGVKNDTSVQVISGVEAGDELVVATAGEKAPGAGNGGGNGRHRGG
ncbi:efflux RND transporter periplasmic adaptor subunit [Novosphingobium naphthalenivorans]|uniref:efflux RND transporter periplasmic adaptor subunit n=1 Tax=Novosphingobium naphthalenivorans TaxID=273168 RepID=UPI00082DE4DD|nr:efflux RND transporter periplasmic adaptor subunit [Novosphingobium naphthalenivorans]